jgi:CheY-like chemotaxis protein
MRFAVQNLTQQNIQLANERQEYHEANLSKLFSYLTAKNSRPPLAHNGQKAIDLAKSYQPDLIKHIQMPGMEGLEATQQIRRHPNLADIPYCSDSVSHDGRSRTLS